MIFSIKLIFILILLLSFSFTTFAQNDYPSKTITWIVPFGTGGGSDQFARMMEKQIEKISETEIVVINMRCLATVLNDLTLSVQQSP